MLGAGWAPGAFPGDPPNALYISVRSMARIVSFCFGRMHVCVEEDRPCRPKCMFFSACKPSGFRIAQTGGMLRGGGERDGQTAASSASGAQPLSTRHVPGPEESKQAPVIHQYSVCDCREDALHIPGTNFKVQLDSEDEIPADVRLALSVPMRGLETNGDGACGIHAVFGHPSARRQLFARGAREIASRFLGMLPAMAESDPHVASHVSPGCDSCQHVSSTYTPAQ